MSNTKAVWLFILGLTAIRLSFLGTTDLTFDEAHYWMWSERLAPSYFSKGPGVAFVIRAGTAIFGDTEFGVRFWSPILGAGTSLLLYYFTRRLVNATAGFWAVLAINAIPLFHVGNVLMTIDPLSIFFWTAAMFTFWLALEQSPNFSWHWPLTGLLIGLGFLCKYTNAFELVSIVLVLALVPRLRREFKRPGLYSLLGAFAVCMLPPIIWNWQNEWITLTHLRSRGSLDQAAGLHPGELFAFLAAHFFFFSPLIFLGLAWAVIANWRRARQQFKVLYLFWFGMPVFAFYFLLSLNKQAAPNWDVLAFVSWGVLAAAYGNRADGRKRGIAAVFCRRCPDRSRHESPRARYRSPAERGRADSPTRSRGSRARLEIGHRGRGKIAGRARVANGRAPFPDCRSTRSRFGVILLSARQADGRPRVIRRLTSSSPRTF